MVGSGKAIQPLAVEEELQLGVMEKDVMEAGA